MRKKQFDTKVEFKIRKINKDKATKAVQDHSIEGIKSLSDLYRFLTTKIDKILKNIHLWDK